MSSFPCHADDPAPFFPAQYQDFDEKRANLLKTIARSERLAEVRPASRLEVRPRPEMLSTGISEIDAVTGGIPRGCLTELYGAASSGKTSVLVATIAAATRRDETCVLVDASDSFDPASGKAAGMEFSKLLWVRCGDFGKSSSVIPRSSSPCLGKAERREPAADDGRKESKSQAKSEIRLEQVLKTTDLILQGGGFGLVALDLAGIPEKFARRISLASWFRFQRAVEHTKTALLVVSEFPSAQTGAALVVRLCSQPSGVSHQPSGKPAHTEILEVTRVQAEVVRTRLERKPVRSVKTNFATQAVLAG
jgi:recombination protein RecA